MRCDIFFWLDETNYIILHIINKIVKHSCLILSTFASDPSLKLEDKLPKRKVKAYDT